MASNRHQATFACPQHDRIVDLDPVLLFLQNDLQVCDVRYGFYPEAPALHTLRHSFSKTKSACFQVSRLHEALCPERIDDGAY